MVRVELEGEVTELDFEGPILDLMPRVGITPQEYICLLNGEVVTEHEPCSSGDEVSFVRVWSGG